MSTYFKILNYECIDDKYLNTSSESYDKWDVFNYLMKYHKENERLELYIPMWFYEYLESTTLENYSCTLLKALEYFFKIYGVSGYSCELLVIGVKHGKKTS